MFDPAAISLTSALNPGAIPANAVMLENAGTSGDAAEPAQSGGFEALLALQSAQTQIALPSNRIAQQTVATVTLPTLAQSLAQPATGKSLPDAAMPLAAFAGDLAETPDEDRPEDEVAALAFITDPAVLASILAAPERLAGDSTQPGRSTAATAPYLMLVPEPITQNPAPSAKPELAANAAVIALAQAAVIELDPEAMPVLSQEAADSIAPAVNVAAQLQTRPAPSARAGAKAQEPGIEPPVIAVPSEAVKDLADEAALPELPEEMASPVIARATEPAPAQDTAPAGRAEPRAERVDFATLVETLNRAREEASPGTVRVSLSHADFGRVSMRFEQDDKGLSVAMSSADPGFARAVTASNEAASGATSSDTPRGQSSQANTGSSAQGENNRQPQGQRADTPERPAAQLRDTLRRKDDAGSESDIFA
ncbi:hypothetical protein IP81_15900 [Novosphingobium sp. AAP83]|uniref:hypothetical protein n=1 Tax=Novosphingobium sp. AAP83 TaxID=1523425 RepID=UPI0006B94F50|nr:hypothetical protein [Novosphingobium sp. AAP83]KPF90053.1 hypothetical protein IP81_15900 [Novosphingobium sp. AAP83]